MTRYVFQSGYTQSITDNHRRILSRGCSSPALAYGLTYPKLLESMLTGKQHITSGPEAQKNFLVVDAKTETSAVEQAFDRFTSERKDIAVVLINQHVRCLCLESESRG